MATERLLIVAAVLFFAVPSVASAWCRMTTNRDPAISCEPCGGEDQPACLEWDRNCISYAVDEAGARDFTLDEVRTISELSFQPWLDLRCDGAAPGFDVRQLVETSTCGISAYNADDGNVNAIIFVPEFVERYPTMEEAYALTTVWHNTRTGLILDVDMEINEERGTYGVCPAMGGCSDGTIDLQNVMTHEVGHFFGIAHTQDENATMWAFSPPGEVSKRILRTDDLEGFCNVYPPGTFPAEACTNAAYTPKGGLELGCVDPDGCAVTAPGSDAASAWWALLLLSFLGLRRRR